MSAACPGVDAAILACPGKGLNGVERGFFRREAPMSQVDGHPGEMGSRCDDKKPVHTRLRGMTDFLEGYSKDTRRFAAMGPPPPVIA
jgi:hypothetical protein